MSRHRYSEYVHDIDIDAFESAIGWEPQRQGVNQKNEPEDIGQCPDCWSLHKNGDTTGKFAINRDNKVWGCFVCGGGSLLSLAMAVMDMEEDAAEEWLHQFATASAKSDEDFMAEIDAILYHEKRAKPVMPWYNEHIMDRWSHDYAPIQHWLDERGIGEDVAQRAGVAYAAQASRMAPDASRKPYIGPSVYLPHFWGQRLVGWQQRWLDDDRPKWVPKYSNTSNFPKHETVYNWESPKVQDATQPIIVVESVPTVLFLETLGYPAVATFGASVTPEQMRLLRRFNQGVVLARDNDLPGYKWLYFTEEEKMKNRERVVFAAELSRFVPVRVMEAVGEEGSGDDLGDLLAYGDPRFAADAVAMLYEEAAYY